MTEERRTKGMRIDIDDYEDSVDLISQIPQLKNLVSWRSYSGRIERNPLCKYIIYLYSGDTYLNKVRIPLEERKKKALLHAGFKMNDLGEFDGEVMNFVYNLGSEEVLTMVHDYLRFQNDSVWTEIVISETEVDEATKIRLRPMESEDKKSADLKQRLREQCREINSYLETLYKRFYNDHTDVKNRKRATTLESLAKDLQDI